MEELQRLIDENKELENENKEMEMKLDEYYKLVDDKLFIDNISDEEGYVLQTWRCELVSRLINSRRLTKEVFDKIKFLYVSVSSGCLCCGSTKKFIDYYLGHAGNTGLKKLFNNFGYNVYENMYANKFVDNIMRRHYDNKSETLNTFFYKKMLQNEKEKEIFKNYKSTYDDNYVNIICKYIPEYFTTLFNAYDVSYEDLGFTQKFTFLQTLALFNPNFIKYIIDNEVVKRILNETEIKYIPENSPSILHILCKNFLNNVNDVFCISDYRLVNKKDNEGKYCFEFLKYINTYNINKLFIIFCNDEHLEKAFYNLGYSSINKAKLSQIKFKMSIRKVSNFLFKVFHCPYRRILLLSKNIYNYKRKICDL